MQGLCKLSIPVMNRHEMFMHTIKFMSLFIQQDYFTLHYMSYTINPQTKKVYNSHINLFHQGQLKLTLYGNMQCWQCIEEKNLSVMDEILCTMNHLGT